MEENRIYYLRDKSEGANSLCPYRRITVDYENKIGQGEVVVAVLSDKYLRSTRCLNEWHRIMEYDRTKDRVFPIVLNTPIDNGFHNIKKSYDEYFQYWDTDAVPKLREKLNYQNTERLSDSERWIIRNDEPWRPILHNIHELITENVTPKYETTSETVYSDVISALKKYLLKLENKNQPSYKNTKILKCFFLSLIAMLLIFFIIWQKPWISGGETKDNLTEGNADIDEEEWTTSEKWPYGQWAGGSRNGKPHGNNVTVIYRAECVYSYKDPLKRKSKLGQKVVGMYEDGMLIIGDIYDEKGNLIEQNFEPKL